MNNIKKINFLLCLIFSFVFLLSNVFQVEASTRINTYEDAVLETTSGPKDGEVFACKVTYITIDNGERELVWAITDIKAWIKEREAGYYYSCRKTNYEISKDGLSAKIFVTLDKYKSSSAGGDFLDFMAELLYHKECNLIFELNLN